MKKAAKSLEFEQAAMLRDEISELRKLMLSLGQTNDPVKIETYCYSNTFETFAEQ